MTVFSGIKVISFDGDQTLWDFQGVMRNSLGIVLRELEKLDPVAACRLDIPRMIAIRDRVAEELTDQIMNLEQIRLESFKQALRDAGRPDDALAEHLNKVYYRSRFEDIGLYDETLPVLSELKKRFLIGLLSNGNTYPDRCGLEGVFDIVLFSQDCGYEKPAPEFFRIALETAGCRKEELLHIGDSMVNDVTGARNAGIKAVWLNRDGQADEGLPHGVPVIASLHELLQMV